VPVVIWTNGACYLNALDSQNFIDELASWGVLVIVSGTPTGYPPAQGANTIADGSQFVGRMSSFPNLPCDLGISMSRRRMQE
jgi:hypothetical protein